MKKVILFIFLAAFIFATMEVALKIGGNRIDPFQLTFIRFLFGGIFLLPFGIAERKRSDTTLQVRDYLYFLLLGAVCVPVSMLLFQIGVLGSNAATAAVIFSVNPVFTAVFAHFLGKDDKLNKVKTVSLLIAVLGIVMMIRPWDIQPGNSIAGAMISIVAAAAFSLYSVLGGRTLKKAGTFTQTSVSFIFGALLLLIVLIITGKPIFSGISSDIPLVLYVSFVVSGAGYLVYFLAIRYSNATTGSITFFLKPIIAPIIAAIVLSEEITWNMYIGVFLILVASFVMIREKMKTS
ncbi:MAG: DMT family transporter [Clostridiales Family XIII bacterium]|jgi:drug/metabolite transporter (DMT)-like permease|nr:DMT family transporter [Clostridiales Family XIII bacterium]